jgi:lipopolysaccharide/colanic/teichoic acid biosynthesis glycosyltransferase
VVFRQTRPGLHARPFEMIIDELPEVWNVLKDDMSIVGARPLLMQYVPLYSREQARAARFARE